MALTFRHHLLDEAPRELLRRLRDELTNSAVRGDVRDDGTPGGSALHMALVDALDGCVRPRSHVITALDDGDGELRGWCMVDDLVDRASVGFYVDPRRRGGGVGKALVAEATALARRLGLKHLVARPWNASSKDFFKACGFQRDEEPVYGFRVTLDIEDETISRHTTGRPPVRSTGVRP